jgi:hypothetical protein
MLHKEPNNPICGPPDTRIRPVPTHPISHASPIPSSPLLLVALFAAAASLAPATPADWVEFDDQTVSRLVAAPDVGASDTQEKSYAWGDADHDGDVDLVVARKQPFSTPGKRTNVLLLNENGVLVDRTAEFASASDVPGDSGFLTPTNDRNIAMVDVDADGWLDVVTVTAQSGSDPKAIAYPRIYRNLGSDRDVWLGFRHEDARIPAMLSYDGNPGFNPNFAAVAAGDVSGDGYPDLYFGDYDPSGEPPGSDFNDKLLLNRGEIQPGYFDDVTASAFDGLVDLPDSDAPFPVSSWATATGVVDLNGDEASDIVKLSALNSPFYLGVAYGDPLGQGDWTYDVINGPPSPYYFAAGDLNQDDRIDLVITDDGNDQYLLNQGNGIDGLANFTSSMFSFAHDGTGSPPADQGFGGDNAIADLDNDGWEDVLITDVSIDIAGCSRRLSVYRNLGGSPGGNVVLQEQTSGSQCAPFNGNPPSCIVAGVPASALEGVHDVAVFDIDGDDYKDLVLGRCSGTSVYINVPPAPAGGVPDGAEGGSALLVGKEPLGRVRLEWGASCAAGDTDYAVYEGTLGDFTSHLPRACSTDGETTLTFGAGPAAYFLVVPHNGSREGSYGHSSDTAERSASSAACMPQMLLDCD